MADHARNQGKLQRASGQILLGHEYAGRDVAASEDGLRQPLNDQVDALLTDALAGVVRKPVAREGEAIHRQG
ncbi:hypothetical protein Y043_6311 [Burkholderia pseudomallei MSHR2138]|nr:hypothetical protein Y043_6311 [Burkholderia pseudomallei MSHR2138]